MQSLEAADTACNTATTTQASMNRLMNTIEEAIAAAQDSGSKAESAMALARKVGAHLPGNASQCRAALLPLWKEKAATSAAKSGAMPWQLTGPGSHLPLAWRSSLFRLRSPASPCR